MYIKRDKTGGTLNLNSELRSMFVFKAVLYTSIVLAGVQCTLASQFNPSTVVGIFSICGTEKGDYTTLKSLVIHKVLKERIKGTGMKYKLFDICKSSSLLNEAIESISLH